MRNSDDEKLNEKWPVLSDIAMPGIVGNFVSLATRKSEADPAAVLATFLVRFGVEIGSTPYLMIGHKAQRQIICGNRGRHIKGEEGNKCQTSG